MRPGDEGDVSLEINGKKFDGHYRLERGVLTMQYSFWSKKAQLGNLTPDALARLMLAELVAEHGNKRT